MKEHIILIISRGEVIRNFVYSGIAHELRNYYRLTFITVVPNEFLRVYLQENCDLLYELEPLELNYSQRLLHELIDLAHNKYIWSEAAKVRWHMRDAEAKTLSQKLIRSTKKVVSIILSNNRALTILEKLDFRLSKRNKQVLRYAELINKLNPALVFNGSHSHSKIAYNAIQAARINRIKTGAFLFSWDNLTSQGRVFPPHQFYFSWNKSIKEDFLKIYPDYSKSAIKISGTPQFIGHFQEQKHLTKLELYNSLGLRSNEEYFLYSSGMSHHLPEEPYVVARIADMIKSIGSNYKLVVRTYAKDRFDVFEGLKKERPDIIIPEVKWERNFQTPLIEDQAFFSSLLKYCVAGINVASTISLELCMFDKPAINVAYNPPGKDIYPYNYTRFYSFDHYKPIVESGAVELAENEDQMLELLKKAIDCPDSRKKERAELINSFFGNKLDERVTDEFVNLFNQLLKDA